MSSKRAQASIRLNFPDQKQLTTLLAALSPETHATATRRANVNLQKDENSLVLTVEAEDTVALRATLNAYLHWINSTLSVIDAVEKS
ncbi:MAG: KEOPS complex subunit Pcc1 [Candidatus Bathyarchaeota archaeon]|nr:KEOPS complex subunit Pcc1 [Candidatus Bathyarchaeota archaeon]